MNYALRIPEYYKDEINSLKGDVSINQFIVNSIAEKISALKTENYLKQRAGNGSAKHMQNILDKVDDIPASEFDKI